MAGPTLVVRFLGDLKGLGASFSSVEKSASKSAANAHQSFSTFLGAVNKTGVLGPLGGALDGVDQTIGALGEHSKNTGLKMGAIGAGVATAGAVLSQFSSKEQASHQQLQAAIGATGKSYDQYADRIDATVKKQEHYGHAAGDTEDALRTLTQATHDPSKALDYLGTASDVAAGKHESLSAAAMAMGKVYNGNTRLLKEYGITAGETAVKANKALETATKNATKADDAAAKAKQSLVDLHARLSAKSKITVGDQQALRNAEQKVADTSGAAVTAHGKLADAQDKAKASAGTQKETMQKLADVTKGQASAAADTFAGKVAAMRAHLEDSVSTMGQKYGPAIQILGIALTGLGTIYEIVAAAEWSTVWPVLAVIAAIALLAAAAYVIYKNWGTIWGGMKTAVNFVWQIIQDVWHWIAANWPLLLAILLGPIALAVLLIVDHFGTIRNVVKGCVDFIKGLWNGLVAFFSNVVGSIKNVLSGIWGGLQTAFDTVVGGLKGAWNSFKSWIDGIVGAVKGSFSAMWDPMESAFKTVVNGIARAWNDTVGKISVHVPGWVPGIGGKGFDVPSIPTLQTGGIVTRTGLILAHAGEAVTPLPAGGLGGPAVVIEQATFSSDLDVSSFMRRVAHEISTAGV